MTVKQDIFSPISSHHSCHASTLALTVEGDLICAWYAGAYETSPDQAIFIARCKQKSKNEWKWDKPHRVIDTEGKADGNPVLFTSPDGKVWLFFVTLQGRGWATSLLKATISNDGGVNWSEPILLSSVEGYMSRTKPLILQDGTWLLPLYDEKDWSPVFWHSQDFGHTWQEISHIPSPPRLIQPAVIQKPNGHLLAYCRSDTGRIWRLLSTDGGKTWTPPQLTNLPNPNSAVDLARFDDNGLVLAFNNSSEKRTPLSIAYSPDGQERWEFIRNLEVGEGEFSYPCLLAIGDLVHCVYSFRRQTICHVVFDKDWLEFYR